MYYRYILELPNYENHISQCTAHGSKIHSGLTKRPVKRSKRLLDEKITPLVTMSPLDALSMVVRDRFITRGLHLFSGPQGLNLTFINNVPSYRSDLISVSRTGGYNLRSSDSLFLSFSSIRSLATLGDSSFHVAAPKLWNSLPEHTRNIKTLGCFKKAIKTFSFQKAFY